MLELWMVFSIQVYVRAFQRGTNWSFWSMGCKTVVPQCSRSKKYKQTDVVAFPRLSLLCSKSLLFGRPGFDSRRAPTLGTHSFGAHGPKLTYNTSFESPDIFLYEKFKKVDLKAFLSSFMNTQSNLVSYHKTTIVPVSLRPAVDKKLPFCKTF